MFKLVGVLILLIVVAVVAMAYLQLSPLLTFAIVSVGLYLFARKGEGSLWPQGFVQWNQGHGVHLGRKDQYVAGAGADRDTTADYERREAERR